MLVAPTEPPLIKTLGKVDSRPEQYGVDILFVAKGEWVGIQRKEISDLIASVHDGRLAREVAQMQHLSNAMLVVEGKVQWTLDGVLIRKGGGDWGKPWTLQMHRGLLWSVQQKNIWVGESPNEAGTVQLAKEYQAWHKKDRHTAVVRRPGPISVWGKADNKDYGCHLLMGIDGIGPEVAGRIWDKFGGVPMKWTVTREELMAVDGIGPKKADKILGVFNGK